MVRSRWQRFGYAAVNFGQPVSVHEYCRANGLDLRRLPTEARHAEIDKLAQNLMAAIATLIPAVPVPIAAAALLRSETTGLSEFDWKAAFYRLAGELRDSGVFVVMPGATEYAFEVAVNVLRLRRLVIKDGDVYRPAAGEEPLLAYYANSVGEHAAAPLPNSIN
jgi:glycerol-3-phosphate O-acyltransferase